MSDDKDRTRRAYDVIASAWVLRHEAAFFNRPLTLFKSLVPSGRILDLGCGAGRAHDGFPAPAYKYVGIDYSEGMLKEAVSRGHLPVLRMRMERLGFADGSFDACWAVASLQHVPKREVSSVLQEVYRVLRQRGFLYASVPEGDGEGMYARKGFPSRFFANYLRREFIDILVESGFDVLSASRVDEAKDWWEFIARRV